MSAPALGPPGGRPGAAGERRHQPGPAGVAWEERWWFDFAAGDGSLGGYVRLVFRPVERVAWWWAAVIGAGRSLVAVRAHDVRIPARGTEIRTDGVWACLTCESPCEHWSVGLEAFGVALEDSWAAWGDERGDVVPLGLDLEWEAMAPAQSLPGDGEGYGQWCQVHGQVLIADERLEVDARGHREHAWGPPELDRAPGWRLAGDLGDRGPVWARSSGRGTGGSAWLAGGTRAVPAGLITDWGTDGAPIQARLGLETGAVVVEPAYVSPVTVPGVAVVHALSRARPPSGEPGGWAWVGWWR